MPAEVEPEVAEIEAPVIDNCASLQAVDGEQLAMDRWRRLAQQGGEIGRSSGTLYIGSCQEAVQWAGQHVAYVVNAADVDFTGSTPSFGLSKQGCCERRELAHAWRIGDWFCGVCRNHNFKSRTYCNWSQCQSNRWTCQECGNYDYQTGSSATEARVVHLGLGASVRLHIGLIEFVQRPECL